MNPFSLFSAILKGNAHQRRLNSATIIVAGSFGILALGIALSEYFGFLQFFKILNELPDLQIVVIRYSLYAIFTLIFALIVAGALVSGPYLFLRSRDSGFLLTLPIKSHTIFTARFLYQIALIMWTAVIFGIPAIISYGRYSSAGVLYYFASFLLLILLIILATAISNIIVLVVMGLIHRLKPVIIFIVSIVGIAALSDLVIRAITPSNLFSLLASDNPQGNSAALSNLTSHFHYWPSAWYVDSLQSAISGNFWQSQSLLLLIIACIAAILVQSILARLFYRSILQSSQEGSLHNSVTKTSFIKSQGFTFFIYREWLLFRRNRNDVSQFFLFMFLFVLYIGFLFNSPKLSDQVDATWSTRLIFFIIMTICYFTALLALRFAYPYVSLERQKSWYALTLPIARSAAFSARLILVSVATSILIEIIVFSTTYALQLKSFFLFPLALLVPVLSFTLVSITQTLGALLPNRTKSTPEGASTSPSGLLSLSFALIYSSIILLALWGEITESVRQGVIGIALGPTYWFVIVGSIILTIIAWRKGQNVFRRLRLDA